MTEPVVDVIDPGGHGAFVLVCEHASNAVPADLGDLGLAADALDSHIAWDPGALPVARTLSQRLGALLVAARLSRLVYDCNRPPGAADAIAETSEDRRIPGNTGLGPVARRARADRVYHPFHNTLAACLDARIRGGRPPVLLTVHTFTPVYRGVRRDVELGVLHDADARFAEAFLGVAAAADPSLAVRRNAPYGPADGVTHTLVRHALPRGLLNVMLEIRNDLVASAATQRAMADRLCAYATAALDRLSAAGRARSPAS